MDDKRKAIFKDADRTTKIEMRVQDLETKSSDVLSTTYTNKKRLDDTTYLVADLLSRVGILEDARQAQIKLNTKFLLPKYKTPTEPTKQRSLLDIILGR